MDRTGGAADDFLAVDLRINLRALGKDGYGLGPRSVGLMMGVLAVALIVMQGGIVRWLVPRLGEHRLAALGIAAYAVGALLIATRTASAPCWRASCYAASVWRLPAQRFGARLARGRSGRSRRGDGRVPVRHLLARAAVHFRHGVRAAPTQRAVPAGDRRGAAVIWCILAARAAGSRLQAGGMIYSVGERRFEAGATTITSRRARS
jgi:hypothetical protein